MRSLTHLSNSLKHLAPERILFLSIGIAVFAFFVLLPFSTHLEIRLLCAWCVGVFCYLGLGLNLIFDATFERTRHRAQQREANPKTVFTSVIATAVVSIFAIGFMLAQGKNSFVHLTLSMLAILCSWMLTHSLFAFHYARAYYDVDETNPAGTYAGGLEFPMDELPNYWDFMYFAFTISMTAQTSDVTVTSSRLRRLVLGHALVSFFFFAVIVGLSINIIGNLI